jgi:hypothetical protein
LQQTWAWLNSLTPSVFQREQKTPTRKAFS